MARSDVVVKENNYLVWFSQKVFPSVNNKACESFLKRGYFLDKAKGGFWHLEFGGYRGFWEGSCGGLLDVMDISSAKVVEAWINPLIRVRGKGEVRWGCSIY